MRRSIEWRSGMKKERAKKVAAVALAAVLIVSSAVYMIYGVKANTSVASPAATETASAGAREYQSIFKKDGVIDIKIDIAQEDWKSILDNPTAEEYKSATVTVNGTTVKNVGFRSKGNLTLRSVANSDSDRYSFRVKLDKYVEGQNLMGLDEFVVNNMYSDPSYMREYLSYEALREIGADVPEAVFANLYVNGELYGFYLCVEAVDDSFLERSFGEKEGNLYKQEQGSTLQYVEGSNYDKSELKSGDDESKEDLKKLIKVLNEMPQGQKGEIESVLEVDSALRYIAANTVLGNYDSYNGNMAQNYYLYGQEGKFTVIPWDYNMSIGGFGGGGDGTTIPIDEPVMGVDIKSLPLISNLLAVDEYKAKYHAYVQDLLDYLQGFEGRVAELADILRPYVQADPTKFYTMEQFEASIKYSETNTDSQQAEQQGPGNGEQPPRNNWVEGQNGNGQAPPQGRPEGGMKGGPGGGMRMMGNTTSIVNFIKERVENIQKQLAGELPTTGNTTMNGSMRGGDRPF